VSRNTKFVEVRQTFLISQRNLISSAIWLRQTLSDKHMIGTEVGLVHVYCSSQPLFADSQRVEGLLKAHAGNIKRTCEED